MTDSKIIIANWKMQLDLPASVALAEELVRTIGTKQQSVQVALCPSFDSLASVHAVIRKTSIVLGAQDVFWQEKGAYTGEVSAAMLKALGVSLVIIGHSERRKYLHEDDLIVNMKVKAALSEGLIPIVCVGETYEERSAGHTDLILMRQVIEGLKGIALKPSDQVIIAYEPVWVIGTGQAIEPAEAERAVQAIQQSLIDLYPPDTIRGQIRIIYGGSVDAFNIRDYTDITNIQGALVGTASITATAFANLIMQLQ